MLLLDADLEVNGTADRTLTAHPYCGDARLRLRQNMLLGIGGARALAALGIRPSVFHLNDPASAVAVLEVVRQRMVSAETSFDEAVRYVAGQTVFTIHTAAATCHDQFEAGLVERQLGSLADALGMSAQQLAGLGRFDHRDSAEPFCCAVLGLRLSRWANGVSALHGRMARQRWNRLWPGRIEQEVPIGHVTSGVHFPSWLAPQMQELYDRHLERNWHQHSGEPETWAAIEQIDNGELWETHQVLKARLLQFVRRRLARRCVRLEDPSELQLSARQMLHPDVLTIGFAHRYAQFKRPTLVKRHLERLIALCHDQERPVQWVFAGKPDAHDAQSRDLVREIACLAEDPRLAGRLVFVEDYDMNVSRHLVQGVDVWLNTSRTPCEATGTSGQKVVLNGGLNLSTLDGWWSEAYDGINGFAIGTGETHSSPDVQDQRDADELFRTLEQQVVPLYYDRDADGLPRGWLARVKWAIRTLGWRFNAERMLRDYVERCYLPAAAGLSCDMNDHAAPARRW